MRIRDKNLGESLAWIVDALLQDESDNQDTERIKMKKREALESLSYVRDVLMTNEMSPDVDRLVGEEEKARRKLLAQKESDGTSSSQRIGRGCSASAGFGHGFTPPVQCSSNRKATPAGLPSAPSTSKQGLDTRAPWNYTRSSFGSPASTIPSALMPRPPPPTSTSLRRENRKSRDQTRPARTVIKTHWGSPLRRGS